MLDNLLGQNVEWVQALTALAVVGVIAYAVAEVAARMTRTLLMALSGGDPAVVFRGPTVRRPIRITRTVIFAAVLAALLAPALEMVGVRLPIGVTSIALTRWLLGSGLRIVIIALLTYLIVRVAAAASRRLEDIVSHESSPDVQEQLKRARTLSRLVQNALTAFAIVIAALMILRELDVDVVPILTGVGILGLAVGFGAQTLVKDLISGFFLIFENHVRVGDVARINGTGGLVEAITLRTVVLRDLEGIVHIFPNGSIETLANLTKDFAYAVIDVGVAYKEDLDNVIAVLGEIGAELAADPRYRLNVLEPLAILGVDAFEASQVTIKIRVKTLPLKQWDVARELRRRIKKTFDARGIELPFPHLSVCFGEASHPFAVSHVN